MLRMNMPDSNSASSYEDIRVKAFNEHEGTETSCPICKGKGMIARIDEQGNFATRYCECMKRKISLERMERSGLSKVFDEYSLDTYDAREEWQRNILAGAKRYIAESKPGDWFYVGGQVGSGKTHICTGIIRECIDKGMNAVYMMWRGDGTKLKTNITDNDFYEREIYKYKNCDLLYIDDFFKTDKGASPTVGDINLAFEIINYRYINRLRTIFSSERDMKNLLLIDEAVGSRIWERSRDFCFIIGAGKNKNYRLRGVQ